jgi:hypothetical protein
MTARVDFFSNATAQVLPASPGVTFPLSVSNGVLQTASGQPYMILGDAGQGANNIPLCSVGNTFALCQSSADTLPTNATFVAYARDRQQQGFNSVWINILCESYTGCDNTGATQEGTRPFTTQLSGTGFNGGTNYPTRDTCPENGSTTAVPNDMACWNLSTAGAGSSAAYWTHIDGYFQIAAQFGLQVFANPLPVDACGNQTNGFGGVIGFMYFNNSTIAPTNINTFADFLYTRYGNPSSGNYAPNLIWWVGNDYACWDQVGFPSYYAPGSDNVVYNFTARLKSDESASPHPHLIVTELDGISTSLLNTVNPWSTILTLNGSYDGSAPLYDIALTARGQNSTTIPPMMVEAPYQGEGDVESDGTDPGTNITGCGNNQIGGGAGPPASGSPYGDPNACPFRERVMFWNYLISGGAAGWVDGNHYAWQFAAAPGWNNGTGTPCTGTSGAGHSPCLDTVANLNLKNAVAFLTAQGNWYKLVPDLTRSTKANGAGIGVPIASPLLTGCYPNNACATYYMGSNHAWSETGPVPRGMLMNIMPASATTSDGLMGIVYVPGISASCEYHSNFSNTGCVKATGLQVTVNNAKVAAAGSVTAAWYDPSGSMTSPSSIVCSPSTTPCNSGSQTYTTPASGHTDTATADWILLVSASGSPAIRNVALSCGSCSFSSNSLAGNIGTLSSTPSSGITFTLTTTAGSGGAACSTSNGRDNGLFSISGTSLNVGATLLTPTGGGGGNGVYNICAAAAGSGYSNSPYDQPFTVTVTAHQRRKR